jgi:hypothetical protein
VLPDRADFETEQALQELVAIKDTLTYALTLSCFIDDILDGKCFELENQMRNMIMYQYIADNKLPI